ncbi:hypothetical protein [Sphingobacterium siyangense]|uniref:hypothetical protein n=1 Tax=Sphingobacterium siyangense TaxID=459529 RepID=UPI003DA5EA30
MLKDKRILLISVKFFNYEFLIKKELEKMGAEVLLFDERPSNSFLSKALIRFKKEIYQSRINKYYKSLIEQLKTIKIDYLLLIKGEAIPPFFLKFLKDNNLDIICLYYTYDSFKNNPNGLQILSYFDRKYTFDTEDAINHSLLFRPLFYANEYASLAASTQSYAYDVSFVGTAHSDRYKISETVRQWCDVNKLSMYAFYFSPSRLLFKFNKLTNSAFKGFDYKRISFESLSHNDIIDIYRKSKVILDINHPGQNGLTMRTFETLGAKRKLITTNPNITKYPFYHPNNVFIIDRNLVSLDKRFFETEMQEIPLSVYHSMSLTGWIEDIFGLSEKECWAEVLDYNK